MQRPSNNQGWNWKWGRGDLRSVGTQERTWCEDQSSFSKTEVKKKKKIKILSTIDYQQQPNISI